MRRHLKVKTEIIIVGGGHSGLALGACLGAKGFNVICLERAAPCPKSKSHDGRTLALSFRSMQLLHQAGIADVIEKKACPILDIRVADQTAPVYLDFKHKEVGDHPF